MLLMRERLLLAGAVFAAAISVAGCGEDAPSAADETLTDVTVAETQLPVLTTETTAATTLTEATMPVTTTVTTVETTVTTELTIGEIPEIDLTAAVPDEHGLTAEDYAFLSDTVFVGDSICSGLKVYHVLPDQNVLATGSVAARNIFDFQFDLNGADVSVTYGLAALKPRYVIFSMGMNDVNMTSAEQWCANYDYLMNAVRAVLPDATFYVASITPITADSEFCTNERIDLFNATMKAHLEGSGNGFIDVATGLKTWDNGLNPAYTGGDGIHLMPEAYYVYLQQVCAQLVATRAVGGTAANGVSYGWAAPVVTQAPVFAETEPPVTTVTTAKQYLLW